MASESRLVGTQDIATLHGREYPVGAFSSDGVWLLVNAEEMSRLSWPEIMAREVLLVGPAVKLPEAVLERLFRRKVTALLDDVRVDVYDEDEGGVHIFFLGPPAMAKAYGLEGDQHDGWWGQVPRSGLRDVTVEEKDIQREA